VKKYFEKWCYSYERNLEREHQLRRLIDRKHINEIQPYHSNSLLFFFKIKMDNTVCCYFQAQNCGWDKPVQYRQRLEVGTCGLIT
jgi:hypothetical protein